jgi:hypothetical protein
MYLQRSRAKCRLAFLARGILALCVVSSRTIASNQTSATSSQTTQSPPLSFVRAFSSADDVRSRLYKNSRLLRPHIYRLRVWLIVFANRL